MSNDIKISSFEETKLNEKGEEIFVHEMLIEKVSSSRDEATRPDEVGSALLQARSLFNSCEDITDEIKKLGYDTGKSYLVKDKYRIIKVHYYSWGLFWTTLLKSFKNQFNLKKWSPELFKNDIPCTSCNGLGKTSIPKGSKEYDEAFADFEYPTSQYGVELFRYCTPCQGVGFKYVKPKDEDAD